MIIDCHGHYTTAPAALQKFRDEQVACGWVSGSARQLPRMPAAASSLAMWLRA